MKTKDIHLAVVALLVVTTLPAALHAQAAVPAPVQEQITFTLDPFTVSTTRDRGYRKASTITTSRIGVSIYEAPQAVEIISGELLSDVGFTSIRQAFDYSSSVTANKQEVFQSGTFKLRGFELPQYINGIAVAQTASGPGYTATDNVERIELAKGAVGLFYGNSAPNGVANIVTKKPGFINRTQIEIGGGNFDTQKALVDTQAVISKEHGLAYRIIASAAKHTSRLDQEDGYNFFASSVSYRPNDKFNFQAEYDVTNFDQPYAASQSWNLLVNPLYYQQVANPDQTMLNYVKTRYGAADDDAARAVIATRWGINAAKANTVYLQTNWTADYFGAYGKTAYPFVGSTVAWARYSPLGDRFTLASPDSTLSGTSRLAEFSAAFTPFSKTALQYHWVRSTNLQQFERATMLPNPGPLDAAGRVPSLGFGTVQYTYREGYSDTQQLDLSQEVTLLRMRHRFIAGLEARRFVTNNGAASIDQNLGPTQTRPDGTTTTGLASMREYYPFSQPFPRILPLVTGPIIRTRSTPTEYGDWYASYRGTAFKDRLNLLAGIRNVKQETSGLVSTGQSQRTNTFGAIGEVTKGLYAFATRSTTFQFSNSYNVVFLATQLPVPGESVALAPESGKATEFGLKSALFNDRLSGTVSYFEIERTGVPSADINKNSSDPRNLDALSTNDVRFNVNGGRQRVRGVDFDAVWSPNNHLQIVGNVTYLAEATTIADASVNTTNINVSEANARLYDKLFNHRLAKSPRFASSLLAKYQFTEGRLKGAFAGLGIRHTGRYLVSDNVNFDIYVEGETFVDTFAGYRFKLVGQPATVQLNLQNLTDQVNDITREDGFTARLRLTMEF